MLRSKISGSVVALALLAAQIPLAWAAAEEPGRIAVRFGVHPTFERMVFDWPRQVDFRIESRERLTVLEFDQAARIDPAALKAGLKRVASEVQVVESGTQLRLGFTLGDGVRLRTSRLGSKVVIDFLRDADARSPATSPDAEIASTMGPALAGIAPAVGTAASPEAPRELPPAVAPRAALDPPQSLRLISPPASSSSPPAYATVPVPHAAPGAATARVSAGPAGSEIATAVPVDVVRTLDGDALRFEWPQAVGAAVFARGEALWIAFDQRATFDLSQVQARRGDLVGEIQNIPATGAVLRLTPPGGTAAALRRDGTAWLVELPSVLRSRTALGPIAPARLTIHGAGDPPATTLAVEIEGTRAILEVTDPEIGDILVVVPSEAAGAGVGESLSFPQVRLLGTIQGLAIVPLADGIIVRSRQGGVDVTAPRGLDISALPSPASSTPNTQPLFDLVSWRRAGDNFVEARQSLQRTITQTGPAVEGRGAARLDLARFLFARAMGSDALGMLRLVEQDDVQLAASAPVRALRGAAALMVSDLQTARELNHASLDGSAEIRLWRGALAVAEGDSTRAASLFAGVPDISVRYPAPFANRIGLALATARLAANDLVGTHARLNQVADNRPTSAERGEIDYLRGRILAAAGDYAAAVTIWQQVEDGQPVPARVGAALARVDALLAEEKLTPAEAVVELDKLRFAWRGDEREFAVLSRLGRLQVAAGDARMGLQTLRQAVTYFPDRRENKELVAIMGESFQRFFLEDADAGGAPVVMVGVFEEFRELTPSGPRGDEIMRRVADRMIAMDLVERAGELLDHMVKHRLTGAARAALGTRLALVRLLDRKPVEALNALEISQSGELGAELRLERTRLEARALADLGRAREAIQRLEGDLAPDAERLRLEIQWRSEDWAAAADSIGRLMGENYVGFVIDDEQARRIVHLAVVLALAGDEAGLRRTRERFGPAIEHGPYKSIFATLTTHPLGVVPEVGQIAGHLAAAAPLQSFLATYRSRIAGAVPAGG